MERSNAGFWVLVALAVVVGAVTATGHGGELHTRGQAASIVGDIEVDVTDVVVHDGEVEVTVTTANPSDHDLTVTGAAIRVHNASDERLASGSATRVSGDDSLPAEGSVTSTYRIRVSPSDVPALRAALADDAAVTVTQSIRLRGVSTSVVRTDPNPLAEGR